MRLCRHGHGGVGDAVCDLGKGVARAGGDHESVKGDRGPKGLGVDDGMNDLPAAAKSADRTVKFIGAPKAGIGRVDALGHNGKNLLAVRAQAAKRG